MNKQEALQQYLKENNDKPFYILKMIGDKTSKWLLYPQERDQQIEESCNQIQVLPHWVLWDIDPPKTNIRRDRYEEGLRQAHLIEERLKIDGKGFEIYFSGSVGHHIVAKFHELTRYSPSDRQFLKREILKKYGWDTNYDDLKSSSKTTIQMPDTPNRKTLKLKQLVCAFGPIDNKIPQEILYKLIVHNAGKKLRKEMRDKLRQECKETLREIMALPKCVRYIRDEKITEGHRDMALFSLISHLKHIYHYNELVCKVQKWCEEHNNFLNKQQIEQKIHSANKTPAKTNCAYNKMLMKSLKQEELCKGCVNNG